MNIMWWWVFSMFVLNVFLYFCMFLKIISATTVTVHIFLSEIDGHLIFQYLSQSLHCFLVECFIPKWTFKVSGSFSMKSHSLHWYLTKWYVCSFFLCFFITFSLSKTFSQTSQAAGNWSTFVLEWSLDMWILKPCLDVVMKSHFPHLQGK